MNMTDKPTPPDGYELVWGCDFHGDVEEGMQIFYDVWQPSGNIGIPASPLHWYAVPLVKAPTAQKEPIGTDPKKTMGDQKPQLQLIPPALNNEVAKALQNGIDKGYGPFNWRETPVEVMTYLGAMKRHIDDFLDGEDVASDSKVHHMGHIAANCAIILDAAKHGTLVDNRPPKKQP